MSMIISYAIFDSNSGSVQSVGRCDSSLRSKIPVASGFALVDIADEAFNRAAVHYPHYYKFAAGVLVKKNPLVLTASKFTFTANYPHPAPASGVPVIWDFATISWNAPEPVKLWCNGPSGAQLGNFNVVASTPTNLRIQVDPTDPNYFTDRDATPASSEGPGSGAGALILNAEAPSNG